MINYNDNIFTNETKKCLNFDPFYTNNTNYKLNLSTKDEITQKTLKLQYYKCANDCIPIFNNLPPINFHSNISCHCIKQCYNQIKEQLTKI